MEQLNNVKKFNNFKDENEYEYEYKKYDVYLNLINWELIPDINLYSEQVVQIINESLSENVILGKKINFTKSYITPAMINSYVKRELIESPENKKYNRIQIAQLTVISLLKQVYSIDEIVKLFEITYKAVPMERAYKSFVTLLKEGLRYVFLERELLGNKRAEISAIKEKIEQEDFVIETQEQTLLKNITLSIANKIYVEEYLGQVDNK